VTLHAVVEVANALFEMFCPHRVRLVRMTSIASVATVVAIDVARRTGRVMIAIQDKQFVVLE
jgi:hypothetical protein